MTKQQLQIAARLVLEGFDTATVHDRRAFGLDPWHSDQATEKALRSAVSSFLSGLVAGFQQHGIERGLGQVSARDQVLCEQPEQLCRAVRSQ